MIWIYAGIVLFAGPHLFSILLPAARGQLKQGFGEGTYKGVYSLASLAGLVCLAVGYLQTRSGPPSFSVLYEPFASARHLTMTLVWLGLVLIGASHGKGYLKAWVKNPMSLGIALWSTGHLLMNGRTALVLIFGMFLIVALLDIILSTVRGKAPSHQPVIRSDVIAVVAGTVLWLLLALVFHPYALNIAVIG
jgi:uncharacterized membrane protein